MLKKDAFLSGGRFMTDYFRVTNSVIHERFGDETVIVKLDLGRYYNLQGSAEAIWTLASSGFSRERILDTMINTFSGEHAEIVKTTASFLDELVAEELLEPADSFLPEVAAPEVDGGVFVKPHLQKYTDMEELLQLDPIHQVDELGWPSAKAPTT
jgi:hypothetical protein